MLLSSATEQLFKTFSRLYYQKQPFINEPKHIECGAPDFLLNYNGIPRGYIETKDLNNNLDDKSFKEQFSRYSKSLDNLIFTNYLEFRLVIDDKLSSTVIIGTVSRGKITNRHSNTSTTW